MTRIATIFLFAIIVSVNTPAGELFKFPQLLGHFLKHQKEDGYSLFEFLAIHYGGENKDADYPQDEKLPFRNVLLHNISPGIISPFIQPEAVAVIPAPRKVFIHSSSILRSGIVSIFHPPRT